MRINSFKKFEASTNPVYLKVYNSEYWFKDRINFKMIDDIKDMALEYLDEGLILDIYVFFRPSNSYDIIPVCDVIFSHNKLEFEYEKIFSVEGNLSIGNIMYKIKLLKPGGIKASLYEEYLKELKSRISEAYPKEIIC